MGDGIRYEYGERGLDRVMRNGRTVTQGKAAGSLFYSLLRQAASKASDPPKRATFGPWDRAYNGKADPGAKVWMIPFVKGYTRAARFSELWVREAMARNPNVIKVDVLISRVAADRLEIAIDATLRAGAREKIVVDALFSP